MSALAIPAPNSFEAFLEWEEQQDERHEYVNGQVTSMAGASENHETVAGNLFAALHAHLRGKGCKTFKGDMKLRFQAGSVDLSYYPDVMVVCDPADSHTHYKERPKLLAEVMTRFNQDHFEKLFIYQQIESLEEYLIVSQDPVEPRTWVYRRADGWAMPEPIVAGEIELASLGLRIPLADLYLS